MKVIFKTPCRDHEATQERQHPQHAVVVEDAREIDKERLRMIINNISTLKMIIIIVGEVDMFQQQQQQRIVKSHQRRHKRVCESI